MECFDVCNNELVRRSGGKALAKRSVSSRLRNDVIMTDQRPAEQIRMCPFNPRAWFWYADYKSGQTDQQLADAVNSTVKTTTADGHAARDVEAPEQRDEKPGSTESPVREGKRPGLAPDSGYDPSLRAEELDTPKQRLTYSEVPDRPCGHRDETEVRYIN